VIQSIFDPNDLINETDSLLDLWMIAGLIAREMEGIIGEDEKRVLQNRVNALAQHQATYQLLPDKTNLKHLATWLRQFTGGGQAPAGLN